MEEILQQNEKTIVITKEEINESQQVVIKHSQTVSIHSKVIRKPNSPKKDNKPYAMRPRNKKKGKGKDLEEVDLGVEEYAN